MKNKSVNSVIRMETNSDTQTQNNTFFQLNNVHVIYKRFQK